MTTSEIVVTFSVKRRDPNGFSSCQGNREVPYEVQLSEPIGDRALVDGACKPGGKAVTTADCLHNPRFQP